MAEKYFFGVANPHPKDEDYYDDDSHDEDSSDDDSSSEDDSSFEDDSSVDDDIYKDDDDFSDERTIPKTNPILAYIEIVRVVRETLVDIALIYLLLWCIWNFLRTENLDLLVFN